METRLDPESAEWVASLGGQTYEREAAVGRLYALLLRVTTGEVRRRAVHLGVTGPELDDLAHQAAADAVVAILRKLDQFRGDSRFTTWAYRFAILEVSSKVGRHFWRTRSVSLDAEDWERLPDRFGFEPEQQAQWRDLMDEVRRAVQEDLTPRQRQVFVALVLNNVPLDELVAQTGSNRNAIYKTLFDARRKVRAVLVANGYLDSDTTGEA